MSMGSLWEAAASAALAAGVSLGSILQPGDWARVSMQASHYFSTYTTAMDWYQDYVQCAVPQQVGTFLVSVKTVTYMES